MLLAADPAAGSGRFALSAIETSLRCGAGGAAGDKLNCFGSTQIMLTFRVSNMNISLTASPEELRTKFYRLTSRKDIADLLEIEEKRLNFHLHIAHPLHKYKTFSIAKRSGSRRQIDAPVSALKIIQRKLHQVLSAVYKPKDCVHGFTAQKNILLNAKKHVRQEFVLNVDLENFFPSINFGRVRGMFMAKPYQRNDVVATILAQICCHENTLPQGAPTSPIVSNMICGKLDDELRDFAKRHQCVYTRYADDITISTHRSIFPNVIARYSSEDHLHVLGSHLLQIIEKNGFKVNTKKVKLQDTSRRQQVTGLIVNRKVSVKRTYINQIRAMLHAWQKYGFQRAEEEHINKYGHANRSPFKKKPSFAKILRGKIAYLGMVKGQDAPVYVKYLDQYCQLAGIPNKRKIRPPIKKTQVPEITTEGKTDWKHLKIALRKLQEGGLFCELDICFDEYGDEKNAGDTAMIDLCKSLSQKSQSRPYIFIFDSDNSKIVTQTKGNPYKSWGNNVFSFVIPLPPHRKDLSGISIELYYQDSEIMRLDEFGRRLFINSEFHFKSGRHKDLNLNCTDRNKINGSNLNIIDDSVFNEDNQNIALTKENFALHVLEQHENFNDFDYTHFCLIFDIIEQIINENLH